MVIEARMFLLQDGGVALLCSPGEDDALAMLRHLQAVCRETHFLERSPGDPLINAQMERDFLRQSADDPKSSFLCVESGGEIIACASVFPAGKREKTRHRAEIGVSVRKAFWGQGLGKLLMREGIAAARRMGYLYLELSVFADNARALGLYQSLGFAQHGRVPGAFRLPDGTLRDSILMGMALTEPTKEDNDG